MLLIRIPPLPQESLSSWRQRLGQENGYWKYPRFANTTARLDPDRLHNPAERQWLSDLTAMSSSRISELALEHAVKLISNVPISTKPRWAISARESVDKRAGPMCCPLCLAFDQIPYFRVQWRLANVTVCEIHHTPLVDRCAACSSALWPSPIRSANMMRWLSLAHCQACGESLTAQLSDDSGTSHGASTLSPLAQAIGPSSYWDGIHTLSQLMLRKSGAQLNQCEHVTYKNVPLDGDRAWRHIEEVPLHDRRIVITNCEALLRNWPETFVAAARTAGISKVSFSGLDVPEWMDAIVDSHLAIRRRNQFSPEYIQERIADQVALTGVASKAQIRRSLGVVENSVLSQLMFQRRRAYPHELLKMITLFRLAVECTSPERCKLTSLWRDYLIFLLSVVSQRPIVEVCGWSSQQCLAALESQVEEPERAVAVNEAKNAMKIYSIKACGDGTASASYFASRFGAPLLGHSVRQRVSAMMKSHFPPNLWRSIDVFTKMFSNVRASQRSINQRRKT